MEDQLFQLPDGRLLGYSIYGPAQGRPVLYFHGTPSARLEPLLVMIFQVPLLSLLEQYNLRLIAVDRPGMGLSSYDAQRTLQSFAKDSKCLLDHLQVSSCPLLCWSGGGPYALAIAFHYPQLIQGLFLIAGFSRSFGEDEVYEQMGWNKVYFNTARKLPLALHGTLEVVKHAKLHSPISQKLYDLAAADYVYLKEVDKLNAFLDVTVREALQSGTDGAVQEAALYFAPFGFRLQQVETPVYFWWGTDDNTVTYVHAKSMERMLPQVHPHYKTNEGHISIYIKYLGEVLETISVASKNFWST
jgi:pimeloyl-ACP methyl ester carboxylesterase